MDLPARIGRYQLLKSLGSTPLGDRYIARQGEDGPECSVLRLAGFLNTHAAFLEAARAAAERTAGLDHDAISRIVEVIEADRGQHYLICDYVWGVELRVIAERGMTAGRFLPRHLAVAAAAEVADSLDYVHLSTGTASAGRLYHGALSPSHICLTFDGRVRITKLGLGAATGVIIDLIRQGHLKAWSSYLAPEQATGGEVDHRADLFALGTVLYEFTTRRRLFRGRRGSDVLEMVERAEVTPPTRLLASYPAQLEPIVMRALASDPADRYQTAREMGDELREFLRTQKTVEPSDLSDYVRGIFPDRLAEIRALLGPDYRGPSQRLTPAPPMPPKQTKRRASKKKKRPPVPKPTERKAPQPTPPAPPRPPTPSGSFETPTFPRLTPTSVSAMTEAELSADEAPEEAAAPPAPPPTTPSEVAAGPGAAAPAPDEAVDIGLEEVSEPETPPEALADDEREATPRGVPPLDSPEAVDAEPSEPAPPAADRVSEEVVSVAVHTLRKAHPDEFEQATISSHRFVWSIGVVMVLVVVGIVWYGATYEWPWEGIGGGASDRPEVGEAPRPELPETIPVPIQTEPPGAAVAVNGVIATTSTPAEVPLVPNAINTIQVFLDDYETATLDIPIDDAAPVGGIPVTLSEIVQPPDWVPPEPEPEPEPEEVGTGDADAGDAGDVVDEPDVDPWGIPEWDPTVWRPPRGRLHVTTIPEGATVLLNGREMCQAPCGFEVMARMDQHITARMPDYLDTVRVVNPLTYRDEYTGTYITLELRPEPRNVRLNSVFVFDSGPPGAEVRLNGNVVGFTPLRKDDTRIDQLYRVEMTLEGYEPWARSYYPSPGRVIIHPILERVRTAPGLLTVIVEPPVEEPQMSGTQIFLGSNEIGVDIAENVSILRAGTQRITFSWEPPPEIDAGRRRGRVETEVPLGVHITERYQWDGTDFVLIERLEEPIEEEEP